MILLPLFYALYAVFWFCVVATVICLWISTYVLVFLGTVLATSLRATFRAFNQRDPSWPPNPRRPVRRPIPQARWSNRR